MARRDLIRTSACGAIVVAVLSSGLAAAAPVAAAPVVPAAALPPGGSFVPVAPHRIADTRTAGGPTQDIWVPFTEALGVPATQVSAALVNVTVVGAAGPGYFRVTDGGSVGGSSNGNFVARAPSASLSIVPATNGGIRVLTSVRADVVVDVQGYVTTPVAATTDVYTPVTSVRVADSRTGAGLHTFGTADTQPLDVRGRAGIPADARAVVANLTVARAGASTYVTAWSGAGGRPVISNVNAGRGEIVANRALLPLDADGRVNLFNAAGPTDLVVDVVGWVGPSGTGSYFTPTGTSTLGTRLRDTGSDVRSTSASAAVGPQAPTGTAGRAPSADDLAPTTAVWLGLVGDRPVGRGYLTAGPGGGAPTGTSDLNLVPGRAVANSGPVGVAADGTVSVTASAGTRIVVDLQGWFRRAAEAPVTPGVWTTYAPRWNASSLVSSTRASGLPSWFDRGVFGASPLGGTASAVGVDPGRQVWRSTAGGAYTADTNRWQVAARVPALGNVIALAGAGGYADAPVYALTGDGRVLAFGSNSQGQLGAPPTDEVVSSDTPALVPIPSPVVRIGAARGTGYAVQANGKVFSWGAPSGLLGRDAGTAPWLPNLVPGLVSPVAIGGDSGIGVAIDADGGTRWWGSATGSTTPTAVTGTGVCPQTSRLLVDDTATWTLCSSGVVKQLSDDGRAVRATVGGNGVVDIGPSSDPGRVRLLLADGRVADSDTHSAPRYEAGFTDVVTLGGTSTLPVTFVGTHPT